MNPRKRQLIAALLALVALGFVAAPEAKVLAFGLTGRTWSSNATTYFVKANFTDAQAGNAAAQIEAIRSAADEWKLVGQGTFAFNYGGTTTTGTVAADNLNTVFYSPTDGGGALATCWYWFSGSNLTQFDLEFYDRDGSYDFYWAQNPSSNPANREFDLVGVAMHEFGHGLGLGHSSVGAATMFASVAPSDTTRRTLDADDINGYRYIYGSGLPATPAVASVSPSSGWIDGGQTVTVNGSAFPTTGTTIRFGGVPATNVVRQSSSRITCTVPGGSAGGPVAVSAQASGLTGTLSEGFSYLTLRNTSTPALNQWQILEARIPAAPNVFFQGCLSLGNSGIACNSFGDPWDLRVIPVEADWLLDFTVLNAQTFMTRNFLGVTDGQGHKTFQAFVPNLPQLAGLTFYACYVTGNMGGSPSGISYIGNSVAITIP